MMRRLLPVPLLALLAGCDNAFISRDCPAMTAPALEIRVVDKETDAILNAGAEGAWVSGRHSGTLGHEPNFPEQDFLVFGPAGRYSLVVRHAGYLTWGSDDIRVRTGECGVQTSRLRVELQRDGAPGT